MYQQYLNQATAAVAYLSTDELKELINDDEKLEERINDVVSLLNPICIAQTEDESFQRDLSKFAIDHDVIA